VIFSTYKRKIKYSYFWRIFGAHKFGNKLGCRLGLGVDQQSTAHRHDHNSGENTVGNWWRPNNVRHHL